MTVIKCNAIQPATCRFHKPNAGFDARQVWEKAEKLANDSLAKAGRDNDAEAYEVFLQARADADEAETIFYATTDGLAKLDEEIANIDNPDARHTLEMQRDISQWHLAEAEETNRIDNLYGGPLIPKRSTDGYVLPSVKRGGDALWPTSEGSKYDSEDTVLNVKKKVNADIKEAVKKGFLPAHVTFQVKSSGNRLSVTLCDVADEQLYRFPEEKRYNDYTTSAHELKNRVELIVGAYNKYQYDYVEGRRNVTKFWEKISFEDDWNKEERLAKKAAK